MKLYRVAFAFVLGWFVFTVPSANAAPASCVLLEPASTFSSGSESTGTFSAATVLKDGNIAVGAADGNFYILTRDASVQTKTQLGSGVFAAPLEMKDGRIAVGTEDGVLHVLKRKDLKPDFTLQTRDGIFGSPIQEDDGTLVFGSYDQNLYFVTPDGKGLLHFPTHGAVVATPVRVNSTTLAVASTDRWVYWVDLAGQQRASFMTNGKIFGKPVVLKDGTLVVASDDGFIYWLDSKGKLRSKFNAGSPVVTDLAKTESTHGEVIVAAAVDGVLHFINASGKEVSSYHSHSIQLSAPAVITADTVAFGTGEGEMVLVGLDGKLKGTFQVANSPVGAANSDSSSNQSQHLGLAPADEYFGQGRMSVLGVHSALVAFSIDISQDIKNASKDLEAIKLTEDAIQDWESKYPQDTWLAREYFNLARVFEKASTLETQIRAIRNQSWLEGHYPHTWYANTAHTKLVSEKVERGIRSFPVSMGNHFIALPSHDHSVFIVKVTDQPTTCEVLR